MREWPVLLLVGFAWGQGIALPETGREIFRAACVGCHGADGKGAARNSIGFEPPATFPDFTDCNATTRETSVLWRSIIHYGGPERGFSEIMPSFTEALTSEQIAAVGEYLRSFCREAGWPRGELNLPRALVTEKAFPEDEVVTETAFNATGEGGVGSKLVYERRFGRANQVELNMPFGWVAYQQGGWFSGLGDLTLGYKRLVASSLRTGSIFSLSGELILPTGDAARGLGKGVTIFEGFAAYGQLLPKNSFVQFQTGFETPVRESDVPRAVYWRTALGKSLAGNKGYGRLWSPMVEFIADHEFENGGKTNWDVVPEFQVTLSQRQHIRANFGVRIPVNNTEYRPVQVIFYLLWDWFDGGLREGWSRR